MDKYKKQSKNLKILVIIILVFLTLSLPISFLYLFIQNITDFDSLLKNYISSNSSIFVPWFSDINIFWFITEKNAKIYLSLGQVIDFFILINLASYFERLFYQYIKKSYIEGYLYEYDIYFPCSYDNFKNLDNNSNNFDLNDNIGYLFEFHHLNQKNNENFNSINYEEFKGTIGEEKFRYKLFQNEIFYFFLIFYKKHYYFLPYFFPLCSCFFSFLTNYSRNLEWLQNFLNTLFKNSSIYISKIGVLIC